MGDDTRSRLHAQLLRLRSRHEEHGGRAIGDLRGVARGVDAVLAERGLELRQLLHRCVRPNPLILLERRLHALKLHFHGHDLVLESPLIARSGGLHVALKPKAVDLLSRDPPLLGDLLRRDALRGKRILADKLRRKGEARPVGKTGAQRHARHVLHAAADRHVADVRLDQVRREVDRLLAGAALPVDGRRRDRVGVAGSEQGVAGDVGRLIADLIDTAGDHVLDNVRLHARTPRYLLQHLRQQRNRVHAAQAASAPPYRSPHRLDDDDICIFHAILLSATKVLLSAAILANAHASGRDRRTSTRPLARTGACRPGFGAPQRG